MGMFIMANLLGSSVQISTLPLPVLSTLQASGLVFNSICATLILGEPFTRWSFWGTLLVSGGAVLIAVFGAIPSPAHNLKELLVLFERKAFIIWMSLQAVFVIAICIVTELVSSFSSLAQNSRFRLLRGLSYGCISGVLSAHSLLMAKSAVELIIKAIVDGANYFVHWQAWMIVLALVFLALSQLYYLHRGLKLVSTSVLYPLVFCVYNIIAILDGLIYFNQTELITPLQACLITLGTVILLSGVLALSWRLSDEQHNPAVGQSSLAPGLGLVEDTDGEEEEEELLLGSDAGANDEEDVVPKTYSYQTFGPEQAENGVKCKPTPLTPTRRKSVATSIRTTTPRWQERAEIWGELDDQDVPQSPMLHVNRSRSSTLPALSESAALLPTRRNVSGESPFGIEGGGQASPAGPSPRRTFRRRRKSTGFPGFTARRKSSDGLQDTIGGIWKLRWWNKNKNKGKGSPRSRPVSSTFPEYRDDPGDREEGGPSNSGGGGGSGDGSPSAGRRRQDRDSPV